MKLIAANYRLAVGLNTAILGAAALGTLRPIAILLTHCWAEVQRVDRRWPPTPVGNQS